MAEYLDKSGLTYLWGKLKTYIANAFTDAAFGYYGYCDTAAATQAKVVTIANFPTSAAQIKGGTAIRVRFAYAQTYNGTPTLNVNSTGAINISYRADNAGGRYMWNAGDVLTLVYYKPTSGNPQWCIENGTLATTSYYGMTALTDSVSSTSTTRAATPNSVKTAYDLANTANTTANAAVPATRKVNNKALSADISLTANDVGALPSSTAIPSKTSDLTNDSGFPVKSTASITLTAAGWSNKTQTVSCTGVTASNTVIVAPVGATDAANWASGSVWCTAQGAGTLTFVCETVPTAAISVNVVILS